MRVIVGAFAVPGGEPFAVEMGLRVWDTQVLGGTGLVGV
jgi:hypothetical protein